MAGYCTICGGRLTRHLPEVRDPLTNEIFAICKCGECGLGHTVPQPENMTPYYPSDYYGSRHGLTLRCCVKRRLGFIESVTPPGTGKRLLDIGCGDGSFLLAAREAGWEVAGTELNPELARSAGLDVKERIEQVLNGPPFDCITMWHTLEHMKDIKLTLTQIAGLLKPDGRLIIAVPDNGSFQARVFRRKWLHLDVPRHLYHFDIKSLNSCLKSAGYTIQRQWHHEFEYDLLGWSQSALNWMMPRSNIFFDTLTGKPRDYSRSIILSNNILGILLTFLSLPAVALETWCRRGGTLVVSARLRHPESNS